MESRDVPRKDNSPSRRLKFPGLTGKGVRVAVVDSGIDPTHPKIGRIAGGVRISIDQGGQVVFGEDSGDCAGHGTACAGIIRRKAPDAELFSVRIFDESLSADGRALEAAIRWSIEQRMDVVNLSLGTTDATFFDLLAQACREACTAGIVLIGAEHNDGLESYPVAFPEVIGVTGARIYEKYGFIYRPGDMIECAARGDEQRLCWLNGSEIMMGGSSFAAPHVTAFVALIREAIPGAPIQAVREALKANALNRSEAHAGVGRVPREAPAESKYSWIRRAALFPYNKEMHAFVRFADLLSFEISGVADPIGKGLVGRDAGEAIGIAHCGLRIQPLIEDALSEADTLILGYVDRLSGVAGRDLLQDSIRTAIERRINVFSFLPVPKDAYGDLHRAAEARAVRIVYPWISPEEVLEVLNRPQREGLVTAPVLGVFGTSSSQGKFTVQLGLRQALIRSGYRVGQVGTEHHSELFGMDLAFPMGYASPLDFPLQWYGPFLDRKLRQLCQERRPEIIVVGSQSGTIPYDIDNPATHTLPSIAFLLGTRPDACVLVVNSVDPVDYIRDTIDALRVFGKAPTIMLAMSDKEKHIRSAYGRTLVTPRRLSQEEIQRRLEELEETFGLPAVAAASEEGRLRMVEAVLDHFAAERPP